MENGRVKASRLPQKFTLLEDPREFPKSWLAGEDLANEIWDEEPTNWRALIICGIFSFISAIGGAMANMGHWPYMKEIDPDATTRFFGVASALVKVAHALSTLIFSFICYKWQTVRVVLLLGRLITFIGCILYLLVEFIPNDRRYYMTFCWMLFGAGFSSVTVLRVYVVHMSSRHDRAKAYSLTALAMLAAHIIGPLLQLVFTTIGYPGWVICSGLKVNVYSAPVWLALVLTAISIGLIYFKLEEIPKKKIVEEEEQFTISSWKKHWRALKGVDVLWSVVLVCFMEKLLSAFTMTMLMSIASPLKMALFHLKGTAVVMVESISGVGTGVLAAITVGISLLTNCTKRISARYLFLASNLILLMFYVLTYPYPFDSSPLELYNETTKAGCNPKDYSWCSSDRSISIYLFVTVSVICSGIGMPIGGISLDTIYSHLLENVDQAILQGLFAFTDDVIQIGGPLLATFLFTSYGQVPIWIMNSAVTLVGILLWLLFMGKMSPTHNVISRNGKR